MPSRALVVSNSGGQPGGITGKSGPRRLRGATGGVFWLYMFFLVDFFLHLSARIPGYGVLRPTLLLVLIISAALFVQRDNLKGRGKDPIFQAILLLIGYIVITVPLVEYPGSVVKNNLPDFVKAIVFLFFTALIIDSPRRLKIFLAVFVGCQVIRILEPLYLNITEGYWGNKTYMAGEFAYRLAGAPSDVINSNELGFVIVTAIPFLHYLLFSSGWKLKALYLALMPCLLYALILTMSRGAFIALLVVAWMIFKESSKKTLLIVIAIGVAMAGWSVMSPTQKDRYLSLVSDDSAGSATVQGRLDGIVNEFKLGFSRPIVGHGVGTTPEAKTHKLGKAQASHNMYGELLVEIGLLGALIFLVFILRIYQRFMKNRAVFESYSVGGFEFFEHLNKCLIALIWMYAVYSINYYGLSQYYWYLLGGLSIAFGRIVEGLGEQVTPEVNVDVGTKYRFGPNRITC